LKDKLKAIKTLSKGQRGKNTKLKAGGPNKKSLYKLEING
jgi:hypothetical protein